MADITSPKSAGAAIDALSPAEPARAVERSSPAQVRSPPRSTTHTDSRSPEHSPQNPTNQTTGIVWHPPENALDPRVTGRGGTYRGASTLSPRHGNGGR